MVTYWANQIAHDEVRHGGDHDASLDPLHPRLRRDVLRVVTVAVGLTDRAVIAADEVPNLP